MLEENKEVINFWKTYLVFFAEFAVISLTSPPKPLHSSVLSSPRMKQPFSTVPSFDITAVQESITNGPLHEVSPAQAAGSCSPPGDSQVHITTASEQGEEPPQKQATDCKSLLRVHR